MKTSISHILLPSNLIIWSNQTRLNNAHIYIQEWLQLQLEILVSAWKAKDYFCFFLIQHKHLCFFGTWRMGFLSGSFFFLDLLLFYSCQPHESSYLCCLNLIEHFTWKLSFEIFVDLGSNRKRKAVVSVLLWQSFVFSSSCKVSIDDELKSTTWIRSRFLAPCKAKFECSAEWL